MRREGLLRSDVAALMLGALGLCTMYLSLRGAAFQDISGRYVILVLPSAILCLVALAIGYVGRRRDRQRHQELAEAQRRGYASKWLMPVGDQVATIIARGLVVLVVLGSTFLVMTVAERWGWYYLGLTRSDIASAAGAGILLCVVLTMVCTWRRLQAENRRLADPLCPLCGYVLYGAEDRRCPECGMLFDLDEVNTTLAYVDEKGRLQPKAQDSASGG